MVAVPKIVRLAERPVDVEVLAAKGEYEDTL